MAYCSTVCVCAQSYSHVQLFATPWTVAHQAPLSIEFFRQEYWSGLPFPTLENGIKIGEMKASNVPQGEGE